MKLSVVLITKNLEWNIARLIGSVLEATASLPAVQVVVVDSASTDRTVEIARAFPVRVLRLPADRVLTAAAGRYVGYRHTDGDLVLFIDGDMEFCAGWLGQAIREMRDHPDVAAVGGWWVDLPKFTQPTDAIRLEQRLREHPPADARHVGGSAMYRRSALEEVGSFNPYLYSDEEPELCLRLRAAGYRIRRLGAPIAFHYTDPAESITTLVRRRHRRLWLGMGQILRYSLRSGIFWSYVRERGFAFAPAVVIIAVVACVAWSLEAHRLAPVAIALGGLAVMLAVDALRKRSLYRSAYSFVQRAFMLDGTVRGFFVHPADPSTYPLDAEDLTAAPAPPADLPPTAGGTRRYRAQPIVP